MTLEELAASMQECQDCGLGTGRKHLVFGEGDPAADLMLVGEGPGAQEDEQGHPFIGTAGQLLSKILLAAGLSREEVFIGNIVKCRPQNKRLESGQYVGGNSNRPPNTEEINACLPYLEAQIAIIRPRIILCLGSVAARALIDPKFLITKDRGKWYDQYGIKMMATFHPAALLRDPRRKRDVWEDMKLIMKEMELLKSAD
ncbi:MAG: uracil-DNA glycosylase [Bacillota bacterium]